VNKGVGSTKSFTPFTKVRNGFIMRFYTLFMNLEPVSDILVSSYFNDFRQRTLCQGACLSTFQV